MEYLDRILIDRRKSSISLKSPAKINLHLRVLDKRTDGYHNLENLMQTISFFDEIEITLISEAQKTSITLECKNEKVPQGDKNIAVRAAKKFLEAAGIKNSVGIKLNKRIPMGAGLGGGSSNAGTVLLGLNALAGNPLGINKLTEIAMDLGSDVPFFLHGGLALCRGKGEIVKPLESLPEFWIILVYPGVSMQTGLTYEIFEKKRVTNRIGNVKLYNSGNLLCVNDIVSALHNDLEEAAIMLNPSLRSIATTLEKSGCKKAMVTGSGSTVFGVCETKTEAEQISTKLKKLIKKSFLVITASNRL